MKTDVLSMPLALLQQSFEQNGIPKFRASQAYSWLIKNAGFSEMKNLSPALREKLAEHYCIAQADIVKTLESKRDGTKKFLFQLQDGNIVEGVLMRYHYGNTLCLSSQVGCRMGCAFCASTLEGCIRNLTAGEMHKMALTVNALEKTPQQRGVTNIVIMGSGEPLDNYDQVILFLRLISAQEGVNISPRNISLSTCGLVPKIYQLMDEALPITLAISLHAPNNDIRSQILPVNRAFPLEELIPACVEYTHRTKRRIVFEYALIDGVNDSLACAQELCQLLRGVMCHINLIPLNRVSERNLRPAAQPAIRAFLDELEHRGMSVTVRREMGSDIEGACGQLRRRYLGKTPS